MDKTHIEFVVRMKMSDMIFNQHMKGCYRMSAILIAIELINVFGFHLLKAIITLPEELTIYNLIITFALSFLVIINNAIHKKAWDKAKEEMEDIYIGLQMLATEDKKEYNRLHKDLCPTIPLDEEQ